MIKINPNDISSHVTMGKIYTKLKNFRLAVETLHRIKSRHPDNIEALEVAG